MIDEHRELKPGELAIGLDRGGSWMIIHAHDFQNQCVLSVEMPTKGAVELANAILDVAAQVGQK